MRPVPNLNPHRTPQAFAAIVLAVSVLTGCGTDRDSTAGSAAVVEQETDGLHGTLVEPSLRLAKVTLRDTRGNAVQLDRLPTDKAIALFFGFTNCDDVCPTTMADLASARHALSEAAAQRIAIVFVTVDPRRDTPAVLRRWLDQFDNSIVGLRGPTALVNQAERSLYADQSSIATQANPETDPTATPRADEHSHEHEPSTSPQSAGDYEVNHSGSVYVFGPRGETVLYSGGTTVDQYAADFTRLLSRS